MPDTLSAWINVFIAVVSVGIAVIQMSLYRYLKTPYLLIIACGFIYFAVIRILIVMSDLAIINLSDSFTRNVTGVGYVMIMIGSIGLFVFVKKAFVDAARLLKEKGVPLPNTWKHIDEEILKLKETSDQKLTENGDHDGKK